jgi:hypothetical protein
MKSRSEINLAGICPVCYSEKGATGNDASDP